MLKRGEIVTADVGDVMGQYEVWGFMGSDLKVDVA